jgi:predicted DNA-binding transcriptional regulator AlpA
VYTQCVPLVRTEELVDAKEVARLLGLAHRNAVSGYLRRYPDMPRPVVDLGPNRPLLWLRPEVEAWANARARRGQRLPRRPMAMPAEEGLLSKPDGNAPLGGRRQQGGPKRGGSDHEKSTPP